MIKHNIFIIDFKISYNILKEVKSNLSFKIFYYDNTINFLKFLKSNNPDLLNSLIIVKNKNSNIFDNKKINIRKFVYFEKFPIPLNKLIEKINIKLIQQRYNYQSKINLKNYVLDLNSRIISKKNQNAKLTEKEIEIILFLHEKKKPCLISELQNEIWHYSLELETHTVETHIYRLRKKIKNVFNDDKFIVSNDNGYNIL